MDIARQRNDFWADFAVRHWERLAFGTDHAPVDVQVSQLALFDSIVQCSERSLVKRSTFLSVIWGRYVRPFLCKRIGVRNLNAKYSPKVEFRFYIDSPKLSGTLRFIHSAGFIRKRYLPQRSDVNFDGYHDRIKRLLNPPWRAWLRLRERRYGLVVNNPEIVDRELWIWEREFLKPLFQKIGINNRGTYNAIFIGDYGKTPFGVHHDPESVFHIPVIGMKAMRTWSPDFVHRHPGIKGSYDYSSYLNESMLVTASPGGFLYWPSRDWHISEPTNRGLSVSIALSLLVFDDTVNASFGKGKASDADDATLESKKTISFNPFDLQGSANKVPPEFVDRWRIDTVGHAWLRYITAIGFHTPPLPVVRAQLEPETVFRGMPEWPIIYMEHPAGMSVGVDGHVFVCPTQDCVKRLIETLNRRGVWTTNQLIEEIVHDGQQTAVAYYFLGEIFRVRQERGAALDLVPSKSGSLG